MAAATHRLLARTELTVRVSQGTPGDLATGARTQLERVDGVAVDDLEIAGLQPGLNDTTVEAVATLSIDGEVGVGQDTERFDPEGHVAERLASGFGVEPERVELIEPAG
ncbi:hypothetical protein [Halorubrum vacuolatum]|uniref:Uncharacterized protein n=1 Tax=Halorubrum vacuolatum TaxID=63740 RepID=A0A238US35_HALVU|nr:hypothetical protein [Halorubrum vacuolatum]SNR24960.1 hypothetical protein SAMN06264855_101316 [Halorubrum vacuolatum]